MIHSSSLLLVAQIPLGLALGVVIGLAYFALLRRNVELYASQGRLGFAVAMHIVRFVSVALAFTFIVEVGAPAMLGAFASFLAIRTLVTRRAALSP